MGTDSEFPTGGGRRFLGMGGRQLNICFFVSHINNFYWDRNFFNFMRFLGQLWQNRRLALPHEVLGPLWEVLDPPLLRSTMQDLQNF